MNRWAHYRHCVPTIAEEKCIKSWITGKIERGDTRPGLFPRITNPPKRQLSSPRQPRPVVEVSRLSLFYSAPRPLIVLQQIES